MTEAFPFVYINLDGSARELSPKERDYLMQDFLPFDSNRPYIKSCHQSLDGYGSRSGYMLRTNVPAHIPVQPVNPEYDSLYKYDYRAESIEAARLVGDIVRKSENGSVVSIIPNPNLSKEERFEMFCQYELTKQAEREHLARHPDAK